MSTVHQMSKNNQIIFVKGAPDQIIDHCRYYQKNGIKEKIDMDIKNKIMTQNRELAREALRVLAVTFKTTDTDKAGNPERIKDSEKELIFLGLIAMIDPLREEVMESIKTCLDAGIRPVMITGDYSITAEAIATELGIFCTGNKIITGNLLEKMSQSELEEVVENVTIFTRAPCYKHRIVCALQ